MDLCYCLDQVIPSSASGTASFFSKVHAWPLFAIVDVGSAQSLLNAMHLSVREELIREEAGRRAAQQQQALQQQLHLLGLPQSIAPPAWRMEALPLTATETFASRITRYVSQAFSRRNSQEGFRRLSASSTDGSRTRSGHPPASLPGAGGATARSAIGVMP